MLMSKWLIWLSGALSSSRKSMRQAYWCLSILATSSQRKASTANEGMRKRAFWMKGRIFNYAKYKAYNAGILTSRVSPRNTSRAMCLLWSHPVARYSEGQPAEGYTYGCSTGLLREVWNEGEFRQKCQFDDREQTLCTLWNLFPGKASNSSAMEREEQSSGVAALQEPKDEAVGHSSLSSGHESSNGHGTAQNSPSRMVEPVHDITNPLRSSKSRELRYNCSGKRLRWGVRSCGLDPAECRHKKT